MNLWTEECVYVSCLKSVLKMKCLCLCFSFQFICIVVPHRLWSGQEIPRQQDTTAHTVQRRQKSHRHSSLCQHQRTLGHRAEVSTPAQIIYSIFAHCAPIHVTNFRQIIVCSICNRGGRKNWYSASRFFLQWFWIYSELVYFFPHMARDKKNPQLLFVNFRTLKEQLF